MNDVLLNRRREMSTKPQLPSQYRAVKSLKTVGYANYNGGIFMSYTISDTFYKTTIQINFDNITGNTTQDIIGGNSIQKTNFFLKPDIVNLGNGWVHNSITLNEPLRSFSLLATGERFINTTKYPAYNSPYGGSRYGLKNWWIMTSGYNESPNIGTIAGKITIDDINGKNVVTMIPCERLSDNKFGWYDTYRKLFINRDADNIHWEECDFDFES